ncbi:hypothetical protein [Paenibacillus campi]|uniref:hypothetical protein n=1 Tax=Paenibacillus campi TaxID=3106031 RepID=UPI002AFFFB24|nr:hypothetical protein [Paenibacillus sp. SGZ-1014]
MGRGFGKQVGKEAVEEGSKRVGSAYDHVYTSTTPLDDLFPELKGVNPHYVEGAGPGWVEY